MTYCLISSLLISSLIQTHKSSIYLLKSLSTARGNSQMQKIFQTKTFEHRHRANRWHSPVKRRILCKYAGMLQATVCDTSQPPWRTEDARNVQLLVRCVNSRDGKKKKKKHQQQNTDNPKNNKKEKTVKVDATKSVPTSDTMLQTQRCPSSFQKTHRCLPTLLPPPCSPTLRRSAGLKTA